jgi:hypothetical protein
MMLGATRPTWLGAGQRTDAMAAMLYVPRMPQSLPDTVATRARNIANVAQDLGRELIRSGQVSPTSALVDMVVFIQTEAELILADLRDCDAN